MEGHRKYQEIEQRINQSVHSYRVPSTVDKSTALDLILKKIERREKPAYGFISIYRKPGLVATLAAAAALILVFLIFPARERISNTAVAEQSVSFRLPDESRVVLAPGSDVSFGKEFKTREVKLKGEGYFEVNPGNSFTVKTAKGNVEVLGTRFSVIGKNDTLRVECFEGSVKVSSNAGEELLKPGDAIMATQNNMEMMAAVKAEYPSFARFKASYNSIEIAAVFKDIEEFFGVQIEENINEKRLYTGTFETGSLETALTLLCVPLNLNYKLENQSKVIVN